MMMSRPGPRRGRSAHAAGVVGWARRMRVALRIAHRSSRRAVGRSALIVALVTLPVAGMTAVCVVTASSTPTGAERATVLLGRTGASITMIASDRISQSPDGTQWQDESAEPGTTTTPAALSAVIPAGEPAIPVLDTAATVRTRSGQASMAVEVGTVWSPSLRGRFRMLHGHAPRSADEMLATPAALDRIGARIGDEIPVLAPNAGSVRVVGTIDPRWQGRSQEVLYGAPGAFGTPKDLLDARGVTAYLPDARLAWSQVQGLNRRGALVVSRDVLLDPPRLRMYDETYMSGSPYLDYFYGSMIIAFAVLEVLMLAGAAFLVGARTQERALATVASVGARRGTLVAIISASGVVLGAISGLVGVAAGIGASAGFMALTDDGSATRYWGFHVSWPVLLAIAVGSVAIGWLGALVPAVRGSRLDVVAALRGARRPLPPRHHRPIVGVVVVFVGIAATVAGGLLLIVLESARSGPPPRIIAPVSTGLLLGGPGLMILGLLLISGLMLRTLARCSSRGPIPLRLATRDAARNAGRSVPAVAAVLVTVFIAVFAMTMIFSSEKSARAGYEWGARPGQLVLPLGWWDSGNTEHELDATDVASAARQTLTDPTIAVLKAVPDGTEYSTADALPPGMHAADLVPHLDVPAGNQCPTDPGSLDFDDRASEGSAAQSAYLTDPRCATRMASLDSALWVMDARDLQAVTGRAPSATVRAALTHGKAVVLNPLYARAGAVSVSWWPVGRWQKADANVQRTTPTRVDRLDAVDDAAQPLLPYGVVISPETAKAHHLPFTARSVLATPKRSATQQQLDALDGRIDVRAGSPDVYHASAETGPPSSAGPTSWALLGLSGLIAIGAAGVAVALARSDGRRDQAALAAVGAGPGTTRAFGFWQAVTITGLGTLLGAGVGLVPAMAMTLPGSGSGMMLTPPWLQIGAAAVLLPLATGCLVWALPARRAAAPRAAVG